MSSLFLVLFTFFIGLLFGSFFNVVALRTLDGGNLAFPPSHCTECKHKLSPSDLIPLFSYFLLKGKCRYCDCKISSIYPKGELLTAIFFSVVVYTFKETIFLNHDLLIHLIFASFLVFSAITDMKKMIVPDRFVIVGSLIILIFRIFNENTAYFLLSAFIMFLFMLLIFYLSKGGMGGADVKIYFLIGLTLGLEKAILSLFYASFVSLLFNIGSLVKKEKKEIPFIPYIVIGTILTYVFEVSLFL